jgi:alpha-N-acetylglucosamine transferase
MGLTNIVFRLKVIFVSLLIILQFFVGLKFQKNIFFDRKYISKWIHLFYNYLKKSLLILIYIIPILKKNSRKKMLLI